MGRWINSDMHRDFALLLFIRLSSDQNKVSINNLIQYDDLYFKEDDDKLFDGVVFNLSRKTGKKIFSQFIRKKLRIHITLSFLTFNIKGTCYL